MKFEPRTVVAIDGDRFLVNGEATLRGREFRGVAIEGLLLNSRMANATFDDDNPLTRALWAYPDTGRWDAERNTDELIDMLPEYAEHGLHCIDINLQGASPLGYYRSDPATLARLLARIREGAPDATEAAVWKGLESTTLQPWDSSGFAPDGEPKVAHLARAARLIEAADAAGLVVCMGLFYFGQDERLADEAAVLRAVDAAVGWVLERGYGNVILEINNECDIPRYEHPILCPPRVHELIQRAAHIGVDGRRLLVGTSFTRRELPPDTVISASDFILLHGNGMDAPSEVGARVEAVRAAAAFAGQPIAYNEDDHFDFDAQHNNFAEALGHRAGWGFFDPGSGAGGSAAYGDYVHGYQNPPVNWGLNTERKRAFFEFLRAVSGA